MGENIRPEESSASTDDVLEVIRKKLKEANEKFRMEGNHEGDSVNITDEEKQPIFEDDTDFDEVVLNENNQVSPEEELRHNIKKVEENIKEEFNPLKDLHSVGEHTLQEDDITDEDKAEFRKEEEKREREEKARKGEDEPVNLEENEDQLEEDALEYADDDDELTDDIDEDITDEEEVEEEDKDSLHKDITDFRGEDYEEYMDAKRKSERLSEPKSLEEMEKEWMQEQAKKQDKQETHTFEAPLSEALNSPKSDGMASSIKTDSRFTNITKFASGSSPLGAPKKSIGEENIKSEPLEEDTNEQNQDNNDKKNDKSTSEEMDINLKKDSIKPDKDSSESNQVKGFDNIFLEKIAHLIDKKLEDFTQKVAPLDSKAKPFPLLEDLILDALRPALEKWIDNNQDSILNIIEKVSEKYMAEAFSKTKAKK